MIQEPIIILAPTTRKTIADLVGYLTRMTRLEIECREDSDFVFTAYRFLRALSDSAIMCGYEGWQLESVDGTWGAARVIRSFRAFVEEEEKEKAESTFPDGEAPVDLYIRVLGLLKD